MRTLPAICIRRKALLVPQAFSRRCECARYHAAIPIIHESYRSSFGEGVIASGVIYRADKFVRVPQIQIERGVEVAHTLVADLFGMIERQSIPMQGIAWVALMSRDVMRGDAGIVIVMPRPPRTEE